MRKKGRREEEYNNNNTLISLHSSSYILLLLLEISDLDYDFNFVGRVGGMRIIILILQIVNDH